MKRVVYKHRNSTKLVCNSGDIRLSKYHCKTVKLILSKMKQNGYKNWFLVGPIYEGRNGSRDMQVCVSGKVKVNENIYEGVTRETFEELGIFIDLSQLCILYSKCERQKSYNHYISVFGMYENYQHITKHFRTQNTQDDHCNKISVFYLIPTLSTALNFLHHSNNNFHERDIIGIGIVKVSDV